MGAKPEKDVLIVDDDEAIRKLMLVALERLGLDCGTARDGVDALDQIHGTRYAVVLLDLMMPRLDGRGVVARLRENAAAAAERPVVIILTAFSEVGDPVLDRTIVHAIVRKPFDLHELAGLLHACFTPASRRGETFSQDVPNRSAPQCRRNNLPPFRAFRTIAGSRFG